MNELPWMGLARTYVGLREVKGTKHNPKLIAMLDRMGTYSKESKAWWRDDETPWCGLFVGYIMGESGRYVVKEWYRAKEWASREMTRLSHPAYGCIAVLDRVGGGHVGFVAGTDSKGRIMLIGGNQGDMVNIAAFDPSRITGYYWPSRWDGKVLHSIPFEGRFNLPVLKHDGTVSTNEA